VPQHVGAHPGDFFVTSPSAVLKKAIHRNSSPGLAWILRAYC